MLMVSILMACSPASAPREPAAASGIILNITQRTFTELDTVEIRTASGETLTFIVEGDTDLTPGHAREHMSFVEPITVYYRETERGLVAVRITD
jgi:hypothetical protein